MSVHPKLDDQIRHIVAHTIGGASPAPEDPIELAQSAAEIEVDVETLREWRNEYQWWTTDDEWREGVADALVGEILRAIETPGPRHFTRWRAWRWLIRQLYAIGIIAGSSTTFDWSGERSQILCWSGQRSKHTGKRIGPNYVLWWPVRKWRCVFKFHHWPTNDIVAFGMCSKCLPCPECKQAAPLEHECEAVPS